MNAEMQNKLDWQAFLYVAGEMSADEAATFEALLAVDQTTREAVARSIELSASVYSAFESQRAATENVTPKPFAYPHASRRHSKTYWLSMFACVTTAACILAAIVLRNGIFNAEMNRGASLTLDRSSATIDELALNWTTVRNDAQVGDRGFDLGGDEPNDRNAASESWEPAADEVPKWLEEAFPSKSESTGEHEVVR